jgi:hypothetical protein
MIFTGLGTSLVGSHSDMRVIENAIDYMIQEGTPSNKIVIGLGAYGRIYTLSDPACRDVCCPFSGAASGDCAGADGFMPYFTIDEYVSGGFYESINLNPTSGSATTTRKCWRSRLPLLPTFVFVGTCFGQSTCWPSQWFSVSTVPRPLLPCLNLLSRRLILRRPTPP